MFGIGKGEETPEKKPKDGSHFKFNIGDEVRDRITGLVGVVILRADFLTGCSIYGVDRVTDHGITNSDISEDRVEMVTKEKVKIDDLETFEFDLGEAVRDTVTGYQGTITSRLQQSSGVNRYAVDRLSNTGGHLVSSFDEHRLERVGQPKKEVPKPKGRTGGGPLPRMGALR